MIKLRDYQQSIFNQIIDCSENVVFQLETGGGKTAIINNLAALKPTIIIAHRNMLIEQISNTLTKSKINHQIIAGSQIIKRCQLFMRNNGANYEGQVWVASVQTLASWHKSGKLNIDKVKVEQVIIDEVHHLASGNQWALTGEIFKSARFIGATATPCRLDGRGLHKDCGGIFDTLIQAEQLKKDGTQWLIANNFLCDYECWCPPTSIDFSKLKRHGCGDYTADSIDNAMNEKVVGEVVEHYKRLAHNKTAIVYCAKIERAAEISKNFVNSGYSATYIASTLGIAENMRRLDAFRWGDVKILVNVEMATEGFDLPSVQCLIMLRPTASLVLAKQMIGRVMRAKKDAQNAVIIDHVSNIYKHGLPDDDIFWTLTGTPKNKSERVCGCNNCDAVFNIYLKNCPNCYESNVMLKRAKHINSLEELKIIDAELAQKMRAKSKYVEFQQLKEIADLEHELMLKTKIQLPIWRSTYGNDAIGNACIKIIDWFLMQVADCGISISEINKFTTGKKPSLDFWMLNFNMRSIKNQEQEKCRELLLKCLSN